MNDTTQQAAAAAEGQQLDAQWHRVSPMAIVDFAIRMISAIAQQWSALLPLFVLAISAGEKAPLLIGSIIAVILVFAALIGTLSYFYFRYRVDKNQFLVRRGVISRKRLSLDFDRVQSVNISEPIYFRPFKLAVLKLESAGSSGQEVSLNGIKTGYAREVRAAVLAYQKDHPVDAGTETPAAKATGAEQGEQVLLTRSLPEIVRYGLSNNGIWLFAALLSSFLGSQAEAIGDVLVPSVQPLTDFFQQFGTPGIIAMVLLIMLGIVALLLGLSVLSAILQLLGYRLVRDGERLIRSSGLGEKREISLKTSKIQTITWSQNIIAVLLKRVHIKLRQAGYVRNANQAMESGFVIPSLSDREAFEISETLDAGLDTSSIPIKPISMHYIPRVWVMLSLLPGLTIGLLAAFADARVAFGFLGLLVFLPFIYLAWRKAGYGWNATHGLVKGGILGASRSYFPLYKVQHVTLSQSPGQRRRGYASLKINLAGNTQNIYWLPLEDAEAFRDLAIYRAETDKRHWI